MAIKLGQKNSTFKTQLELQSNGQLRIEIDMTIQTPTSEAQPYTIHKFDHNLPTSLIKEVNSFKPTSQTSMSNLIR
jgi:hypothetical protein